MKKEVFFYVLIIIPSCYGCSDQSDIDAGNGYKFVLTKGVEELHL